MQARKLREVDSSAAITIPIDFLRHAGLAEPEGSESVLRERPEVFVSYDPESREVSFVLPEPSEPVDAQIREQIERIKAQEGRKVEAGLTQEDEKRLKAGMGDA